MPLLKIQTNQPLTEEKRRALATDASKAVADMLGKPERYVMVSVEQNPAMLFGGNDAPLAYLELKSIGLPQGKTGEFSATLAALLNQHLNLPAERVYIEFADAARSMWGWNGGTF
jgi:phenylpyruvate tautomerase PptA (4-oxalocrotonate tautomerase family)